MCFFTICRGPKFKILSPSIFDTGSPLRSCVLSPYHLGHTAHRRRSRTESRTWSRSRCRIWSRTSPPAAWCTAPPAQSRKSPSTCLRKPAQEDVRNHWTIPWRPGELYLIAFLLGYCGALSVLKRMYKWLFTALICCHLMGAVTMWVPGHLDRRSHTWSRTWSKHIAIISNGATALLSTALLTSYLVSHLSS